MATDAHDGPYSIGSDQWPGTSRVIEEAGELIQVLGKLIGAGGRTAHWDGSNLVDRLTEEIGDLRAALDFFIAANGLAAQAINERSQIKSAQYTEWHHQNRG
ncbi:hypothetical protein [Actinokineospora sp. NBRC 105648]|uniref:hypothetical protein n=1 Tax=Actinokineospora sp. NBRC 105648 TaxID=3032206 RepID=UPI0024A2131F|nr:hypothetical protein [Actinokineospora sp. NBRC 105648]GLZ43056.1 hypothetical protein Acsp05_66800 [Actinokineospora sp. NBRC 105648]